MEMSKKFEKIVLKKLDDHDKRFDEHDKKLDEHTRILGEHTKKLDEHTRILDEHTRILNEHTRILDEHTKILDEHTKKLDEHTVTLARIEQYLIRIEYKLTNEIPALFDGYSFNIEKTNRVEVKQKETDRKVEINSIKISDLERTSKIHDGQLKNLISNKNN